MRIPLWVWIMMGVMGAAAAIFLIDRLLLWLEAGGWIYYRKTNGQYTNNMWHNVMLEMQQFMEPSKRHVIEIKREEHVENEKPGEMYRDLLYDVDEQPSDNAQTDSCSKQS